MFLKTFPKVNAASLKEDLVAPLRLWYLLKALDKKGSGSFPLEDIYNIFTKKKSPHYIYGKRRMRSVLQAGMGIFWWERDGHLRYLSADNVARNMGFVNNATRAKVSIEDLLESHSQAKAVLFGTVHAIREGKPISQGNLEAETGVPPRTQREYNKRAGVRVVTNYAVWPYYWNQQNVQDFAYKSRGNMFPLHDTKGKWGFAHEAEYNRYIASKLPNSYFLNQEEDIVGTYLPVIESTKGSVCFDKVFTSDIKGYKSYDQFVRRGIVLKPNANKKVKLSSACYWLAVPGMRNGMEFDAQMNNKWLENNNIYIWQDSM